jgi:RimJ/RimL family protein N-acetyltransferase
MEILITPRLTLRPPNALDADDVAFCLSDWEVAKMLAFVPWPYSIADAEKWIAGTIDPDAQIYTIHRQSLIGVAGLFGVGEKRTLGYWLGKPWHRNGFMREALTRMFDQTFSNHGVEVIESGAAIDNFASLKLQESLGFQITGTKEAYFVPRQSTVTMVTTVLKKTDWRRGPNMSPGNNQTGNQQQAAHFAA